MAQQVASLFSSTRRDEEEGSDHERHDECRSHTNYTQVSNDPNDKDMLRKVSLQIRPATQGNPNSTPPSTLRGNPSTLRAKKDARNESGI